MKIAIITAAFILVVGAAFGQDSNAQINKLPRVKFDDSALTNDFSGMSGRLTYYACLTSSDVIVAKRDESCTLSLSIHSADSSTLYSVEQESLALSYRNRENAGMTSSSEKADKMTHNSIAAANDAAAESLSTRSTLAALEGFLQAQRALSSQADMISETRVSSAVRLKSRLNLSDHHLFAFGSVYWQLCREWEEATTDIDRNYVLSRIKDVLEAEADARTRLLKRK